MTAEKVATEKPMQLLRDAMYPKKAPTPKQDEAIREVWALAAEYGALPPAARLGFLESVVAITSGRQRWLATRYTPPDNPHYGPLMALLDALIAYGGVIQTRHGAWTQEDLRDAEAKVTREEVAFPVRYPWRTKPDPDRGAPGSRDPAVFRSAQERQAGPQVDSFRVVPRQEVAEKEWFDE